MLNLFAIIGLLLCLTITVAIGIAVITLSVSTYQIGWKATMIKVATDHIASFEKKLVALKADILAGQGDA